VLARFSRELDDKVTKAAHDLRVVVEVGRRLNIADGSQPFADAIELTEFVAQRGENRERCESRRFISLVEAELTTYVPTTRISDPSMGGWPAM
jgi:hypothetical protein